MSFFDDLRAWMGIAPDAPIQTITETPQLPQMAEFDHYGPSKRRGDGIKSTVNLIGSREDPGSALVFVPVPCFSDAELDAMYAQGGYHARVMEILPDYATKKGWRVEIGEDTDAAADVDKMLDIPAKVRQCLIWSRKDGLGALLPVDDSDGSESMLEGLTDELETYRPIVAVQVFDGCEVSEVTRNTDLKASNYMGPEILDIHPQGGGTSFQIHESRVVLVTGPPIPYSFNGVQRPRGLPVMERYRAAINSEVGDRRLRRWPVAADVGDGAQDCRPRRQGSNGQHQQGGLQAP